MSTQAKLSDAEMRFFQFRARQLLLLRREDHAWNEFCKRNTCTCCSCLAASSPKTTKELGVQASPKKPPTRFDRNVQNVASVQSRTLPQTLNEIKTKLERIDLALSGRTALTGEEQTVNQIFPEIKFPRNMGQEESLQNSTNVKRMQLIQSSLQQSIQRLQSSSAVLKNPRPPVIPKKKNSSFFLPHELQKQRTIARSAYLASLAKSKQQPSSSTVKGKVSSKQVNPREKAQRPKVVLNSRNKSNLQLKKEEKQVDNLVTSSPLKDVKDENIEIAVDGIVDDLMGETVLLLNKIKHIKSEKSANKKYFKQAEDAALPTILNFEEHLKEQNVKLPPSSNWAKIRQRLLHFKELPEGKSSIQTPQHSSLEDQNIHATNQAGTLPNLSQNTQPKTLASDPIRKRELFIDPQTAQDIVSYRREYARYLERISRAKKGNFDPWTLANMISEFLLDECIEEVSKELLDVPGSLITDLYDQEFLQTL